MSGPLDVVGYFSKSSAKTTAGSVAIPTSPWCFDAMPVLPSGRAPVGPPPPAAGEPPVPLPPAPAPPFEAPPAPIALPAAPVDSSPAALDAPAVPTTAEPPLLPSPVLAGAVSLLEPQAMPTLAAPRI